jgi:hypothetical protein
MWAYSSVLRDLVFDQSVALWPLLPQHNRSVSPMHCKLPCSAPRSTSDATCTLWLFQQTRSNQHHWRPVALADAPLQGFLKALPVLPVHRVTIRVALSGGCAADVSVRWCQLQPLCVFSVACYRAFNKNNNSGPHTHTSYRWVNCPEVGASYTGRSCTSRGSQCTSYRIPRTTTNSSLYPLKPEEVKDVIENLTK